MRIGTYTPMCTYIYTCMHICMYARWYKHTHVYIVYIIYIYIYIMYKNIPGKNPNRQGVGFIDSIHGFDSREVRLARLASLGSLGTRTYCSAKVTRTQR